MTLSWLSSWHLHETRWTLARHGLKPFTERQWLRTVKPTTQLGRERHPLNDKCYSYSPLLFGDSSIYSLYQVFIKVHIALTSYYIALVQSHQSQVVLGDVGSFAWNIMKPWRCDTWMEANHAELPIEGSFRTGNRIAWKHMRQLKMQLACTNLWKLVDAVDARVLINLPQPPLRPSCGRKWRWPVLGLQRGIKCCLRRWFQASLPKNHGLVAQLIDLQRGHRPRIRLSEKDSQLYATLCNNVSQCCILACTIMYLLLYVYMISCNVSYILSIFVPVL